MASATGRKRQDGGLGLRVELERARGGEARARVLAGPAELAPGVRLVSLVGEPVGPVGEPWRGGCRALEVRLEVAAEALAGAAARLVGREVAGWRIGQVALDLGGDGGVLTLAGPSDAGWPALVQVELAARAEGERVRVVARRVWATGPLAPAGGDLCARIAEAFAAGSGGAVARGAGVVIDPGWVVRRGFSTVGARAPRTAGLVPARVRVEGPGVRVQLVRRDMVEGTGSEGQGGEDMSSEVVEDPLAGLRAALRAGDRRRALAELDRFPALPGHPGARRLARALAQVRAELLRFVDRTRGAAALRAWLAAAPDDPAAWWRFVVQHHRAGDGEGVVRGLVALERTPGPPGAALRRRAAWATVQALALGAGARARAGLEGMSWAGSPAAIAAAWRALALARAVDPEVPVAAIEAAVAAGLAGEAGRPWCAPEAFKARVAEAVLRSGRLDAEAAGLLQRLVGAPGGEGQVAGDRVEGAGDGAARAAGAGFYAQHGRWEELVELLGRALVRQAGPERAATLRELAEVHGRLGDPASAEQALRLALAEPGADAEALHEALVACLEDQGRFAAAAEHAAGCVAAELAAEPPATTSPGRARLLLRLARLRRDRLDDLGGAARAFEALGCYEELPADGLEALAIRYREQGRYEALAGVLRLRLSGAGEAERAGLHRRLAELYDGPLPRPAVAAEQYARAFLAEPAGQAEAGARARALLLAAGGEAAEAVLRGLQDMSEAAGRWAGEVREALARRPEERAAERIAAVAAELARVREELGAGGESRAGGEGASGAPGADGELGAGGDARAEGAAAGGALQARELGAGGEARGGAPARELGAGGEARGGAPARELGAGGEARAGGAAEGYGLRGGAEARARALARELAQLQLAAGDEEGALGTCLAGHGAGDIPLLALAAGLLERRERWPELVQVCERAAGLAGAAGDGEAQAAWLTRAAQVCIDHAEHPRRAMQDARRLLLQACAAGPRCEAARASLVPLAFAERRWDEVLTAAAELRAAGGLDYDVLVLAALTEAWRRGQDALARAIGPRHPEATLRRLVWPALARVALEIAREGSLAQLDAVLAAAAALVGAAEAGRDEVAAKAAVGPTGEERSVEPVGVRQEGAVVEQGPGEVEAAAVGPTGEERSDPTAARREGGVVEQERFVAAMGRLRRALGAWAAGRPLHAGVVLALGRLAEGSGEVERGLALVQLAGFMVPQGRLFAALPAAPVASVEVLARGSALEAREAIAEVLAMMIKETGGIRAPGEPPGPPEAPELAQALALAEEELDRLRTALGLRLPVHALRGGPDGGIGIRNDREPGLVVYPALVRLPAAERRFRLALAAALIRGGLAIVLDPQGASLHELLAALQHLAEPTEAPALPGAQTIVRTWRARGLTGERLTPALRAALADELKFWRRDRAAVARLAYLLRRDALGVAARLSGALDGALRAIGRDARLLGELDERSALQVLATDEAQWLLRSAGLFDEARGAT